MAFKMADKNRETSPRGEDNSVMTKETQIGKSSVYRPFSTDQSQNPSRQIQKTWGPIYKIKYPTLEQEDSRPENDEGTETVEAMNILEEIRKIPVEQLKPSERIGFNYNLLVGGLSPRTLQIANIKNNEEANLSEQEELGIQRPGRSYKRLTKPAYQSNQPKPPTLEKSSLSSFSKTMEAQIAQHSEDFLFLDQSKFPLEAFDTILDHDLIISQTGRSPRYKDGAWKWESCKIKGFDERSKRYIIVFFDEKNMKMVKRLSLLFDNEDETEFFERVEKCKRIREKCKREIRYRHYLSCQESGSSFVAPLSHKWQERILELSVPGDTNKQVAEKLDSQKETIKDLLREIERSYLEAVKHSIVCYKALHPKTLEKLKLKRLPSELQWYQRRSVCSHRGKGMVFTGSKTSARFLRNRIEKDLIATNKTIDNCLFLARRTWLDKFHGCLFVDVSFCPIYPDNFRQKFLKFTGGVIGAATYYRSEDAHGSYQQFSFPCELQQFKLLQEQHSSTFTKHLVEDWRRSLLDYFYDCLYEQVNFFEKEKDDYIKSKLFKFLTVVHLQMKDHIRATILQSIRCWVSFIEFYTFSGKYKRSDDHSLVNSLKKLSIAATLTEDEAAYTETAARAGRRNSLVFSINNPEKDNVRKRITNGNMDLRVLHFPALIDTELRANKDGEVYLYPSLASIKNTFLGSLQRLKSQVKEILRMDFELLPLLQLPKLPIFEFDRSLESEDLDQELNLSCRRIEKMIDEHMSPVVILINLYEEFSPLLCIEVNGYAEALARTKIPSQENGDAENIGLSKYYENEIIRMMNTIEEIEKKSHDSIVFGLVRVDCSKIKKAISNRASELAKNIMTYIARSSKERCEKIQNRYTFMQQTLNKTPEIKNEAELNQMQEYIQKSEDEIDRLEREFNIVESDLRLLEKFSQKLEETSYDGFQLIWSTRLWPSRVRKAVKQSLVVLDRLSIKFINALKDEQAEFEESLQTYKDQVTQFHEFGGNQLDNMNIEKYAEEANLVKEQLEIATKKAQDFAAREETFGWIATDYPTLEDAKKEFESYYNLWTTVSYFDFKRSNWLEGPFLRLKAFEVEEMVSKWWKETKALVLHFEEKNLIQPLKVAEATFEKLESFKSKIPLIQSLASPALRKRHWLQVSNLLREEGLLRDNLQAIELDDRLTLSYLLETLQVEKVSEEIHQIRDVAEKEYSLEKGLDAMMIEWDTNGVKYEMVPYKESGVHILREIEEIVNLLDDQVTKVQTMLGSPYIKPIINRAKSWEQKLKYTQQLIDEWMSLQLTWLYLLPIFSSDDIMRQMPEEARKFGAVDVQFRKILQTIQAQPGVMETSDIGISGHGGNGLSDSGVHPPIGSLLHSFRIANEKLDYVQKGLSTYLELKRLTFPRFFFLSNDELLEILSQTKDPRAVQPHLSKSFEGIHRIEFTNEEMDANMEITSMVSSEGEKVKFSRAVKPNLGKKKGNVELWMLEVEEQMLTSVSSNIDKALIDHEKRDRNEWILNWPGQSVLCTNQIYWTMRTEAILKQNAEDESYSPTIMSKYEDELNDQLINLVTLVRGKLTKLNRKTLGALVVIDVHARDIVHDLVDKKIESAESFEWQSQLRYYYNKPSDNLDLRKQNLKISSRIKGKSKSLKSLDEGTNGCSSVSIKITNSSLIYGFEYLGNSSRLVITPLTDRCYRTLVGAITLNYGGAPAGPAGTGKTETVKDLAKAVAKQCVVFNCSDGLDYQAMGKFFKGLAAAGAWACFDEFNRIEIEVLSVVGQQIATIQNAKRQQLNVFDFEGSMKLPIKQSCNVFITMNPGYAGRTELPDNLQALFRTCAMMVPDYAMIAEIVLYSYGFTKARSMARKITQVLRLCSEQLSSQDHYDYGMRAVKTILDAAGLLKQADSNGTKSEADLTLSAITKVNLPKFTTNDIPLFLGIVQDLFPQQRLPGQPEGGDLYQEIVTKCKLLSLQPKRDFLAKCFQLYETIKVRHGLMVVGETFSGKTSILRTLSNAIDSLYKKDQKNSIQSQYANVNVFTLNPKAITQYQLYGCFDENTHEWTDGILAVTIRNCTKDTSGALKWVVFDGPVDAIWIENMNTVLDDNKKLCLNSGEIIRLTDEMAMIYEVEDLKVASPATVSRCGMVYMDAVQLGWKPLAESYIQTKLPEMMQQDYFPFIADLFEWLVDPSLEIIFQKGMRKFIQISATKMELVSSLITLFGVILTDAFGCENNNKDQTQNFLDKSSIEEFLEASFIWALIWSVGGCLGEQGRRTFSQEFRRLLSGGYSADTGVIVRDAANSRRSLSSIPEDDTVFEYLLSTNNSITWLPWSSVLPEFSISKKQDVSFSSIIVPTVDMARTDSIIDPLLRHKQHVLCTGPTGTGKTVSVAGKRLKELNPNTHTSISLQFSARTSANEVQHLICSKLDKRRRNALGPTRGKTCLVFIDDLNMPQKEKYGAQPPIELLRQWMDHGGWYNLATNEFNSVEDIHFIAAMGPPGGGRNEITQRYVRHFNVVVFLPYETDTLKNIFNVIMDFFVSNKTTGNSNNVATTARSIFALNDSVVSATIDMYNTVSTELLPTPAKVHYTFNLRDLSKIFQGIVQAHLPSETPNLKEYWLRLWAHESLRVFHDRLVSDEDRQWLVKTLRNKLSQYFGLSWENDYINSIIFGSFFFEASSSYQEAPGFDVVTSVVKSHLSSYNEKHLTPMDLVFFRSAIQHVTRISRCIKQCRGHALLVGLGGSGRSSLTKLAVHVAGFNIFEISNTGSYGVSDWKEDMKTVLFEAGTAKGIGEDTGKEVVFLIKDVQITNDQFMEDINNIINSGEIPSLFETEDINRIIDACSEAAEKSMSTKNASSSHTDIMEYFVDRCRRNLHIVLCFSPVGSTFRSRLLTFPSLINCCYIDWFTDWDSNALLSVADHFLKDVSLEPPAVRRVVLKICADMQERVSLLAKNVLEVSGRHYYVTPTSYLELIKSFKRLLKEKMHSMNFLRRKFENGVQKLLHAESEVAIMQQDLTALQPVLQKASEDTEKLMADISIKQKHADGTKKIVVAEEKACNQQAEDALKMRADCEEQLAKALPALEAAVKALKTLSKNDISEVKSMKKPPPGVKLTMEAVCILLEYEPNRIPNPRGKGKVDDYWEVAQKKVLADSKLLQRLLEYDKDNIPPKAIEKVEPYTKLESFSPEVIKKVSKATAGLCKWVHAMVKYNKVAKIVAPKREALQKANIALESAKLDLAEKKASLEDIICLLDRLMSEFEAANNKKRVLVSQVQDCKVKIGRATKLTSGLASEKVRWTKRCKDLAESCNNLVGDILLSSGVIAYLGPFTSTYREKCISQWVKMLVEEKLACSASEYSLVSTLGVPVRIREWCINNLPRDSFSIDNAIMLTNSDRWPLLIDPQGQGNKWIRSTHSESRLIRSNQSNPKFGQTLENAVQFGLVLLVEDIGETLNPKLEPLLLKQVFKNSSISMIRMGENTIEYNHDFSLYITTKLSNPHYSPEVCVKVNLLNFVATHEGLEDQMLGIVVAKEEPKIEEALSRLILESAQNQKLLEDLEDKILKLLSESTGSILDDETLINTLSQSKATSSQIEQRMASAEKTKKKITSSRKAYKPIAVRASLLYFCVSDLNLVEKMYQYSLEWFISLCLQCITKNGKHGGATGGPKSSAGEDSATKDNGTYIHLLIDKLTETLYRSVCQSLLAKDKLLFSFLLCTKIQEKAGIICIREVSYFLKGAAGTVADDQPYTKPSTVSWLTDKQWADITGLDHNQIFSLRFSEKEPKPKTQPVVSEQIKIIPIFMENLSVFEEIYRGKNPEKMLLDHFGSTLTDIQRLILLRILRPDKVIPSIIKYISNFMGQKYVEPPPYDLVHNFKISRNSTPLIFILSPGVNPIVDIHKLAEKNGFQAKYRIISLGQGQGPIAEAQIREAVDMGIWVILQNCHLALSWMPTLERICDRLNHEKNRTHDDFRLWLTTKPSDHFPASILQNGIKITNEPPKGLKANLYRNYSSLLEQATLDQASNQVNLEKMVFSLCFFHAVVQERRKYGSLGWNIPYEFSESDLLISLSQLYVLEKEYDEPPFQMLTYLVGECNYGGRVTDNMDRRAIVDILSDIYCKEALQEGYSFSESGIYHIPSRSGIQSTISYINSLPQVDQPEAFGLHEIADIATATRETNYLISAAIKFQPRKTSNGHISSDVVLLDLTRQIQNKIPPLFDIDEVEQQYPANREECLNSVLTQELRRYNNLLRVVNHSLSNIIKGIKGIVVMNRELETIGAAILIGNVPESWTSVAYPSMKGCSSWISDLLNRIDFFKRWIEFGPPASYWISGFFFTQSFFTGVLQNYARISKIPIDEIDFDHIIQPVTHSSEGQASVYVGALVHGLFVDGATWDNDTMCLGEAKPKQRFSPMAAIWMKPMEVAKLKISYRVYECPVYKTSARSGTLSTTGHSTNYLLSLRIPTCEKHTAKHWVKRGVACICSLDD